MLKVQLLSFFVEVNERGGLAYNIGRIEQSRRHRVEVAGVNLAPHLIRRIV